MGTNFYWITDDHGEQSRHLGKRCAAGFYCYDCDLTLCRGGIAQVHHDTRWLDACPRCGESRPAASQAVMVELGFEKPRTTRPKGVDSAHSFIWAWNPLSAKLICSYHRDDVVIESGHGELFTGQQFLDMLEATCPIRFINSVGEEFS